MKVIIPETIDKDQLTEEELLQMAVVDQYKDLFADMNSEYKDLFEAQSPKIEVTDLVSYYRGLQTIANNGGAALPKPKYLRLPLDEPTFKININDRTIAVPALFANYGFGVKGDAAAEIVFFTCDRFFDGVDLAAMTPGVSTDPNTEGYNCVIQWTNTASRAQGNSKVILADTTETTLTFGWMITQEMTTVSGPIEFAVRWIKLDNDKKIIYSLSTQKASCQIKSTLDLQYDALDVEDISDLVYHRPFYAGVVNSMDGASPQVLQNLIAGIYNLEPITFDMEEPTPVDEGEEGYEEYEAARDAYVAARNAYDALVEQYPVATYPDGIKVFSVEAVSPTGDENRIVYQWYKGSTILHDATAAEYTVTAPGDYYVKIGNKNSDPQDPSKDAGIRYITSPSVTVPGPDEIKFVSLTDTDLDVFGAKVFADGQTTAQVNVKNVAGEEANGRLCYDWYRAPYMNGNAVAETKEYALVAGATYDAEHNVAAENSTNKNTYTPPVGDEAYYICKVVNKKNNAQSAQISKEETPVLVRALPDQPATVTIAFDAQQQLLTATVTWPEGSKSALHPDEWYYQWGRQVGGQYTEASGGAGYGVNTFSVANPPLQDGQTWSDYFYCNVSHNVYGGQGKGAGRSTGPVANIQLEVQVDPDTGATKMVQV